MLSGTKVARRGGFNIVILAVSICGMGILPMWL